MPPNEDLIGGDRAALTALLGEPNLVRREKGVEVLQFSADGCVLFAYLYETQDGTRIRHLEAVAGGARASIAVDTDACLLERARANAQQVLGQ